MVDNRMRFTIDQNMQFPLVEIDLGHGGISLLTTRKYGLSY